MPNDEFEGIDIPLVDIPDGLEDTIFHRAFTETPTLSDDIVPDLYSEEEVSDDSLDDVALDVDSLDDDAENDDHHALDEAGEGPASDDSESLLSDDFDLSSGIEDIGEIGGVGGVGGVEGIGGADATDTGDMTDGADASDNGNDFFGGL